MQPTIPKQPTSSSDQCEVCERSPMFCECVPQQEEDKILIASGEDAYVYS